MTDLLFYNGSEEDLDFLGIGRESLIVAPQANFSKSVAGAITPAGAITGNVVGSNSTSSDGTITPAGELAELSVGIEDFGGAITPNGSISLNQSGYAIATGFDITLNGDVTNTVGVVVGGTITLGGTVSFPQSQSVAGTITPTGAIAGNVVGIFTSGDDELRSKSRRLG